MDDKEDKEKKRTDQVRKRNLGQNGDSQGGAHKPRPDSDFDEGGKPNKKKKKKK
jgi:hypothetical protein